MAAENFKVKKGLEVGTGTTINATGIKVTGIITATQIVGDGSGLTGVVGSGSGVVVKDEGSAVGTAGTINFVGSSVAASISEGTATVTVGINTANIVTDSLNVVGVSTFEDNVFIGSANLTIDGNTQHSGNVNIAQLLNVSGVSTFGGNIDANGDLDVDGQTELDELNVAGITTFNANVDVKAELTANKLILDDDGSSSPTLTIAGDDENVFGMVLVNDTYKSSAAAGFKHTQLNNGEIQVLLRANNSATRLPYKIQQGNAPTGLWDSFTIDADGAVKLGFGGNQKLTTTGTGIEVPDLSVTGVGTIGRVDVNGLVFGTNATTFAAKFPDNAVANFGTDNDLKISHDDTDAIFENTTGQFIFKDTAGEAEFKIQGHEGNSATLYLFADEGDDPDDKWKATAHTDGNLVLNYYKASTSAYAKSAQFTNDGGAQLFHTAVKKFETTGQGVVVTGVCTATSFSGSGVGLTSIPSSQLTGALPSLDGSALTGVTASGTGIVIQHDGSNVGTAGTINFSTNLDVSAISAGIVTITASGGSASQNLFSTIAVSGQSNIVADGTTDTLTFAAGSNITLTTNDSTDTLTITAANDNTQLSNEQVQDIVGAMFSSNTETDITATYQDADGTIDLVVDLSSLNASNLDSGEIPNGRFPATLPAVSGVNLTNLTAGNINGTIATSQIADNAVTFAKMQDVGTGVFIGRNDSGSGDIETLTAAEARTLLNVEDGATADQTAAEIRTLVENASDSNVFTDADHSKLDGIAAGATAGITTAPSNIVATWSISGGSGSGYQFTGPGQDGSEGNPDIYLVRGQRYRFINTTGSSHPFEFRNSANSADYTDGITGSQNGTQDFNVQHDAPSALKYRCTIHTGSMLGNIYIVGQYLQNGADNRVITATNAYQMIGEQALIFDGSRLGIGLTPSGIALDISRNTQGGIRITDTAVTNASYEIRTQTGNSTKMFRLYDVSAGEDKFQISSAGQVKVTATTNTSSTTTGSFVVSGGIGVAKDVFVGGDMTVQHSGLAVNLFESTNNHSRLRIKSGSSSLSQLEFGDQDDADAGEIRYDHANDRMTFHVGNNNEKMRISSEGYVTKPNNPIFFAYMDANTSHDSGDALKLDHTELNVGSGYNTSNYRFTPPVNGHYMFHGSANLMMDSGEYTRSANVRLYKNGSLLAYQTGRNSLTGYQSSYPQVDGTFMVYGTTSDYFTCVVTWETVAGSNLNTTETLHQHGTKFMGYLIG